MADQLVESRQNLEAYKAFLDAQFEKHGSIKVSCKSAKVRTIPQNRSIHLYCELLADAFNDAGLDMETVLKEGVSIPWSPDKVKDDIWRKVQIATLDKKSTTDLSPSEVSVIYDIINRHVVSTFGLFVPFPSKDTMRDNL